MRKIFFIFALASLIYIHDSKAFEGVNPLSQVFSEELRTVYICRNGKTLVYHLRRTCGALSKCSHEVFQTTADLAKTSGKRACLKCE